MQEKIRFYKYHALGNDYIVLDTKDYPEAPSEDFIRLMCHRNFGVGSDGILYGPGTADGLPSLRIFNPDGSEAEKSGNGIRIFSRFLKDAGYQSREFKLHTLGGVVAVRYLEGDLIRVDMGSAEFFGADTLEAGGRSFDVTCVSVGNPHCVIPVEKALPELAHTYGAAVENHPSFPNRINVQFLEVLDRENIKIEIWERGAGYTLASGSSSTASAFAARKRGLIGDAVTVHMPGGTLRIEFSPDGHGHMTGPVTPVCTGVYTPEAAR
jgi:diaminopimelate epimerase